jgi:lipid-A-disaccharide synthase
MVNLIAEQDIVPELVQDAFTAANVVSKLKEILPEGSPRHAMLEGLARMKDRLRAPDPQSTRSATERAADAILALLPGR